MCTGYHYSVILPQNYLVHVYCGLNQGVSVGLLRSFQCPHLLNPIPRGLKYNLFHAGRGIYAPPRDFALTEPMMHQKFCHFIHIKFEHFVGYRKRKQHFKSKNVVVAEKKIFGDRAIRFIVHLLNKLLSLPAPLRSVISFLFYLKCCFLFL